MSFPLIWGLASLYSWLWCTNFLAYTYPHCLFYCESFPENSVSVTSVVFHSATHSHCTAGYGLSLNSFTTQTTTYLLYPDLVSVILTIPRPSYSVVRGVLAWPCLFTSTHLTLNASTAISCLHLSELTATFVSLLFSYHCVPETSFTELLSSAILNSHRVEFLPEQVFWVSSHC